MKPAAEFRPVLRRDALGHKKQDEVGLGNLDHRKILDRPRQVISVAASVKLQWHQHAVAHVVEVAQHRPARRLQFVRKVIAVRIPAIGEHLENPVEALVLGARQGFRLLLFCGGHTITAIMEPSGQATVFALMRQTRWSFPPAPAIPIRGVGCGIFPQG